MIGFKASQPRTETSQLLHTVVKAIDSFYGLLSRCTGSPAPVRFYTIGRP